MTAPSPYAFLRFLHVLGAVLLLGNVIVSGLWAALAMRAASGVPPRAVARNVIVTDWWLTVPGGALLTKTGVTMAWMSGLPLWGTPFVRWGLGGLVTSTVLWLAVLVPLQVRWLRADSPTEAQRVYRWWSVVGWTATVPLVVGLLAMTTRR